MHGPLNVKMADLHCVFLMSYENVCVQDGDVNTRMSYWQVVWRGLVICGGVVVGCIQDIGMNR